MSDECPITKIVCPESTKGCPCWVELIMENTQTGESRVDKDCLFRKLPALMVEVIKASNRPAAAIESTRNEMIKGLGMIAQGVGNLPKPPEQGRIGHG